MKSSGKQAAILAYIPFVGFLIAFFINMENQHSFTTWHIKNMFGLTLMFISAMVIMSQINTFLGDVLFVSTLFLYFYSLFMAVRNREKGVPVLDRHFQKWFKFLNS